MRVPDKYKPTCSCGDKMKLIHYYHYYGDLRMWDCTNKECELNNGEEYMYECEPDEVIMET